MGPSGVGASGEPTAGEAGLVEDLARHLGQGKSIGTSLTLASRVRIDAGAPSATWAGLVVLGDADVVPIPGGRQPPVTRLTIALATIVILAILTVLGLRQRRSQYREGRDALRIHGRR